MLLFTRLALRACLTACDLAHDWIDLAEDAFDFVSDRRWLTRVEDAVFVALARRMRGAR